MKVQDCDTVHKVRMYPHSYNFEFIKKILCYMLKELELRIIICNSNNNALVYKYCSRMQLISGLKFDFKYKSQVIRKRKDLKLKYNL